MDGFSETFKAGEEVQERRRKMETAVVTAKEKDNIFELEFKGIDLETKGGRLTVSNYLKKAFEVHKDTKTKIVLIINPKE